MAPHSFIRATNRVITLTPFQYLYPLIVTGSLLGCYRRAAQQNKLNFDFKKFQMKQFHLLNEMC